MSHLVPNTPQNMNWKTRVYLMGAAIGAAFGLFSAYMYSRANEEDFLRNGGHLNKATTGEMIGLGLAGLAMVRQIAEMGKSQSKKR